MRPALFALALLAVPAACAEFPELDARTSRASASAPYPSLVPLDTLRARAGTPGRAEAAAADLSARASALQARAAALRARPVIDGAARARLLAALDRQG